MRKLLIGATLAAAAIGGVAFSVPAHADDRHEGNRNRIERDLDRRIERLDHHNDRHDNRNRDGKSDHGQRRFDCGAFCSSVGFQRLDREIRKDPRLIEWVRHNFDSDRNNLLDQGEAVRANRAFHHDQYAYGYGGRYH